MCRFQPFLRFWVVARGTLTGSEAEWVFQPFLRFWMLQNPQAVIVEFRRMFQPFLRFWKGCRRRQRRGHRQGGCQHSWLQPVSTLLEILVSKGVSNMPKAVDEVSTLLEILGSTRQNSTAHIAGTHSVSTLLEILEVLIVLMLTAAYVLFQPFLRFWGLCIRFLWVFKFFFGFLSSRRSV